MQAIEMSMLNFGVGLIPLPPVCYEDDVVQKGIIECLDCGILFKKVANFLSCSDCREVNAVKTFDCKGCDKTFPKTHGKMIYCKPCAKEARRQRAVIYERGRRADLKANT